MCGGGVSRKVVPAVSISFVTYEWMREMLDM